MNSEGAAISASAGSETVSERETDSWTLTELERNILNLEKKRFRYPGAKEQVIRAQLGLSAVSYYQKLNTMIDDARIIQAEPALTRRLRHHRDKA